ncbi:MAG: LLM class F420-dependent oxidoreductase [Acidobacteriota bacterium]
MKLAVNIGFLTSTHLDPLPLALEAERLGYDSVWAAEAWGSDAVSLLAWIGARTERIGLGAAILQMPARTPALTAMTAATLDRLSGGRLLLGLGVSGPQVVEGWHGVPYGKPLTRTREYIEIVRAALKRRAPLEFHGSCYDIPLRGGTGVGKPLRLMLQPLRADIPIYLAAIGPKNIALAASMADGWLPVFFSPFHMDVFRDALEAGLAERPANLQQVPFDIAPTVMVALGDDLTRCRESLKPNLALYVGGMGARGRNFYFDLACRYGYQKEAALVQDLFLEGNKKEASAAVPDGLVDEVALCGPRSRVAERLAAWRDAGTTTLICATSDAVALRTMAELVL